MTPSMIVLLTLVGCVVAFPVRPENNLGSVVGIPILIQDLNGEPGEKSSPLTYAILLNEPEVAPNALVEKRNAKPEEEDDLETAAGTYALRPLFVYRQQLAYRERVREAIRRGNRF